MRSCLRLIKSATRYASDAYLTFDFGRKVRYWKLRTKGFLMARESSLSDRL